MALRVLLADESATIKKIFQLALHDFGVELTTVALGVDVVPVAQKFKPDIIFADVLLRKRSGYDVCSEVKQTSDLAAIPVVLIWSGFMELDQNKYTDSRADGHLEKPFETKQLRDLVQNLVPKTKSNPLSSYLTFPKLPDFEEPKATPPPVEKTAVEPMRPVEMTTAGPAPSAPPKNAPPPPPAEVEDLEYSVMKPMPEIERPAAASSWGMETFEEIPVPATDETEETAPDEFMAVELPKRSAPPPLPTKKDKPAPPLQNFEEEADENLWVQKSLADYKLKPNEMQDEEPSVLYQVPEDRIDPDTFVTNTISSRGLRERTTPPSAAKLPPKSISKSSPIYDEDELELDLGSDSQPSHSEPIPQFNERQLEAIIRAQSKELIEKVVWQVLPEIATQIVERELQKLLNERDRKS